jgi:long-subunit acyl-CoA synthetase (AMP-forming)
VFAKLPPARLERLLGLPLVGRLVARKVLQGLGLDAVVQAGSGSAPLPPELIRWYRRLGLRLFEGYGMTEDNSYSHSSSERASEPGWVGVAMAGVQVRISAEGEVLIKSPGQFSGYYRQPELTAASFTEDGFFRTGDLGELRADGLLKITGRAKELFKTAKGKYVAPAPIENLINAHPMVELSLVSGSGQPAAYALLVLAEDLRPRLGEAATRVRVQAELDRLLQAVNRQLADYERLRLLVVARDPWSIENGLLTPTLKLKRSRIEAAVEAQVEAWFGSGERIVWA